MRAADVYGGEQLNTTTVSLPTTDAVVAPPNQPAASFPDAPACRLGVIDGQPWTWLGPFEMVLRAMPLEAWRNPAGQGWQRVKHNPRREVWRARLAGATYYLKYYRADDWNARLKALFRPSACESEWTGGLYALRAGIPAVKPAGYTTGLRRDGRVFALLVTEAVEPAYPLNAFWEQIERDTDPRRRRADVAQVTELLGDLIARAHQAGFEHLDMHAANILVQPIAPGRYRALFVDLHSARLGAPISDRAVVRNLAQLNQWFQRQSSITSRLRFLRAYYRARNEYEVAYPYGRPLGLTLDELVRALARRAARHAERLGSQRDRRTGREGRYFTRLKLAGGWRGMALVRTKHPSPESNASQRVLDRNWWRRQLADPLRWFAETHSTSCKESHSATVRRAVLSHPDGNLPVIIKRPRARNWRRRISLLLPPSRSRRGWRLGHALLHRHLATARPLAVLERRVGPLVLDSLLITEALPGAQDLETFLTTGCAELDPHTLWQRKQELTRLLVRHLRLLEERGFVHRDCKASNTLVVRYPEMKLLWIDLDGLRRAPRWLLRRRRRNQALVTLAASVMELPTVTRTDHVRFLKGYTARFGADRYAWRKLWRELEPQVSAKCRARQRRRAWKLRHYGRP